MRAVGARRAGRLRAPAPLPVGGRRWWTGRRVLDLASGEGFGAAILARRRRLGGGHRDRRADRRSQRAQLRRRSNLGFARGGRPDLSAFRRRLFGAVVAFEMIEHVAEQERVLAEIRRVLAPDGLLAHLHARASDRLQRGDQPAQPVPRPRAQPRRVRALLGGHFDARGHWGQRTITGSALSALVGAATATVRRRRADASSSSRRAMMEPVPPGLSPCYLVAVASARRHCPRSARESTLGDAGLRARCAQAERRPGRDAARDLEAVRSVAEQRRSALKVAQLRRDRPDRNLAHEVEPDCRAPPRAEADRAAGHAPGRAGGGRAELRRASRAQSLWRLSSVGARTCLSRARRRALGSSARGGQAPLSASGGCAERSDRGDAERRERDRSRARDRASSGARLPSSRPEVSMVIPVYSGGRASPGVPGVDLASARPASATR